MNSANLKRKRRRLKKSVKRRLILVVAIILTGISISFARRIFIANTPADVGIVRVDRFRDLNAVHLQYARSNGIMPINKDQDFMETADLLVKERKLVKLTDSKYYRVDHLSHSFPYLTPETTRLLEMIGKRFQKKLNEKKLGKFRFRVSSVLRTQESQRRLSRSNINATGDSSHLYGTTFDIGWKKIYKETFWGRSHLVAHAPAIQALSETLAELRKEGHLVVVTEMKEACFQIGRAHV